MRVSLRSALAVGSSSLLVLGLGCAREAPTGPQANQRTGPALDRSAPSPAASTVPSGERAFGQVTIEPAYDDQTGNVIYLLTPDKSPFPTHTSNHAVAPLYLVLYPPGSTVGTLNCMGVPGNCPDHDAEVAGAGTSIMPGVYGTDPTLVPGHDHLVAPPAGGGDFNVAWEVVEVLFTNSAAANTHLTTEAAIEAAVASGDAIEVDLGFAFHCSVVAGSAYWNGAPVGSAG
jgi:hypothetical protein